VVADEGDGGGEDGENPSLLTGNAGVLVDNVSTADFPQVTFEMEAYDADGFFITTLFPSAVEISEGDNLLLANEVTLLEPGLETIIAVNPGVLFLNTYLGYTNWDRVQSTLINWAESIPPGGKDTYHLIGGELVQELDYSSPRSFAGMIEEYQPNFLAESPSLYSLSTALELAADENKDPRTKSAVLWITPTLNNTLLELLPPIIDQAEALGTPVHIWLVGTSYAADSQSAILMKELAERTNGSFFLYTGLEFLPEVEDAFQPLRYYYQIGYPSQVTDPGKHTFNITVYYESLELKAAQQNFEVQLQPPNPIFLSPPTQIEQKWEIPGNAIDAKLQPEYAHLSLMIEFPDGIQRTITSSKLYINGELLQENTIPPFDRFEWYIGDTQETSTYQVYAEITDGLGFTSRTLEIPITLAVGEKPLAFFSNTRLVAAVAISIAALILVIVITLSGRRRNLLLEQREAAKAFSDPLTQPVLISQEGAEPVVSTAPKETSQLTPVNQSYMEQISPARLVFLSGISPNDPEKVIVLESDEITIGSSAKKADVVVEKPTIQDVHARIRRNTQGNLMLYDCDSDSGTWIRYAPVSKHGAQLRDGDLIQFGQEVFRFEQAKFAVRQIDSDADSGQE
jgi:pSer/pThr/pTyr-binding forkhead associated (FHA) protein